MTPQAPRDIRHWLALATIILIAALIRCWNLSTPGLWQDELYSLELANGWGLSDQRLPLDSPLTNIPDMTRLRDAKPVGAIFTGLREDNHPPLYFLLLRAWEHFGESDASLRWLSILFSLAAIVLLERIVTETSGGAAGLIAAGLMAINGPQIEFARELRNYMPMTTFALAAALPIVRMKTRGVTRGRLVAAALATAAMLLTHYYAIAVAAAIGFWALTSMRGAARRSALAALGIGGAIFAVLWLPSLLAQIPNLGQNNQWLNDYGDAAPRTTLGLLWRIPMRLLLDPHSIQRLYNAEWLFGVLWLVLPIGYVMNPAARLWIIWIGATVGMVTSIDLAHDSHQLSMIRYCLAATPAACALVAQCGPAIPLSAKRFIVPAIAAALMLIALPDAWTPLWKIDWTAETQSVAANVAPGDAIVFIDEKNGAQAGAMALAFSRQLGDTMPSPIFLLTGPASPTTIEALKPHRIWVIGMEIMTNRYLAGFAVTTKWFPPPPWPGVVLGRIE